MDSLKLLGGLAALSVLGGVVGSFAGLVTALGSNVAAVVGLVVVFAVVGTVSALGVAGRPSSGNPYW